MSVEMALPHHKENFTSHVRNIADADTVHTDIKRVSVELPHVSMGVIYDTDHILTRHFVILQEPAADNTRNKRTVAVRLFADRIGIKTYSTEAGIPEELERYSEEVEISKPAPAPPHEDAPEDEETATNNFLTLFSRLVTKDSPTGGNAERTLDPDHVTTLLKAISLTYGPKKNTTDASKDLLDFINYQFEIGDVDDPFGL